MEIRHDELPVTLPDHIFGEVHLQVYHDVNNDLVTISEKRGIIVKTFKIAIKPSADLIPTYVDFHTAGNTTDIIDVKWTVSNIGNDMNTIMTWKDSLVLKKTKYHSKSSLFTPNDDLIVIHQHQNKMKLQSMQDYSYDVTIVLPLFITGSYHLYIITDATYKVSERNGELNNILSANKLFTKTLPPVPTFNVIVLNVSATQLVAGNIISVSYQVENNGSALQISSWFDEFLLIDSEDVTKSYLVLGQRLVMLQSTDHYINTVDLILPTELIGGHYRIMVNVDVKKTILVTSTSAYTQEIIITEAEKYDLFVESELKTLIAFSGQPITIQYDVSNVGPGKVLSLKPWYDALYLSEDNNLGRYRSPCLIF